MARGARRAGTASILVAALLMVLPSAPAPAAGQLDGDASTISISGGGWGHGVGLSQYGAQAQARSGRSYQQILASYFTGIWFDTLGAGIPDPGPIWVGIRQNLTSIDIGVRSLRAEPGYVTITRGEGEAQERLDVFTGNAFNVTFGEAGCTLAVQDVVWPPGSCSFDVTWDGWSDDPSVVLDVPAGGGGRSYARGSLHVRPNQPAGVAPTGFHLVMEIGLEAYLYGLAEVPYSWAQEALRTQAVAGRSYAANKMALRGNPADSALRQQLCWCQLYDSTYDQYYVGWGYGDARWTAAVNDTRGVVMAHRDVKGLAGEPVALPSYYSSSTFGHTEDSGVAFGTGDTPEYLKGVWDGWSIDPLAGNPYARWTKTLTLNQTAAALGMDSVTGAEITDCPELTGPAWSTSGAALEVRFSGTVNGTAGSKCFYTRTLRTKLGLRSMQITGVETSLVFGPDPQAVAPPVYRTRVGVHDPTSGVWTLRNDDGSTPAFYYGVPNDLPMACDWEGDGIDTVGLYRSTDGFLYLRHTNDQGYADIAIYYGIPEDLPVCGDWNGDGIQTIGVFRPSERRFYLRNSNTQGFGEIELVLDAPGSTPVAGDWDGDGIDTVGLWDPVTRKLSLTGGVADPAVVTVFNYTGAATGDRLVTGDWNGDGVDSVGVFRPASATFYLRDTFTQASANIVIQFGTSKLNPVTGAWGP